MGAVVGSVKTLRRFPVKSMLGEEPDAVEIVDTGIVGDRAWGLVDAETGKVASAKHPRLWASLLGLRAEYVGTPAPAGEIRIHLADGSVVHSSDDDVDARLSDATGRVVRLVSAPPAGAVYDEEWPDVDGIAPAKFIESTSTGRSTDGNALSSLPVGMLAPGTFQDVAPLTVLTTASLRTARELHPDGDWDERRFRSPLLLDTDAEGFPEQDWLGRRLTIGAVEIEITAPTPRCVMVTVAQPDLPADGETLRTLARHNRLDVMGTGRFACLGVYATVARPGRIAAGDLVSLED